MRVAVFVENIFNPTLFQQRLKGLKKQGLKVRESIQIVN